MNWILIVVPAIFLLALITVADNWDRFKRFHDELGDIARRFVDRLFYFAVFFPTVLLASQAFSIVGYDIRIIEQIVMAFIVSFSLVVSQEVKEEVL